MFNQLVKPEVQAFIKEHQNSDLNRMLLNKNKYPGIPIDLVVDQIKAREKAKEKLPLWFAKEEIIMPPLLSMEQCSSEQTAEYKSSLFSGKVCVDLTGGAGVDTFYFSKHFEQVHYVEQNRELAEIAKHNFELLGASNITVHPISSEQFLADLKEKVDLIYIDPARRDGQGKVFRFEDCSPNILVLQETLLQKATSVLVKASPMLDITLGVSQLKNVRGVQVISLKNEVKELLFIQQESATNTTRIKALNLPSTHPFEFNLEDQVSPTIGPVLTYLYEPNASILKSGGQNWLSKKHPVQKLHKNTHLFTSQALVKDFPGRTFKVEKVVKYNKKEIRSAIGEVKANISVRNFPDSVDAFRKKTSLKDGGYYYLFGYTALNENLEVAICKKVL